MNGDIVHRVHRALTEWSRGTDKLVVGVDGYPGVGKTSLVKDLMKLDPDLLAVCRDDFIIERSAFEKILGRAKDRTIPFEYDMLDLERFRRFIQDYKTSLGSRTNVGYNRVTGKVDVATTYDFSRPIMLVEGVFLFHPNLTDNLFDRRIFLRGDQRVIGERRVAREEARWGKNYFPEDHPDSYFRLAMQAFSRYVSTYHPEERADLVVSTTSA